MNAIIRLLPVILVIVGFIFLARWLYKAYFLEAFTEQAKKAHELALKRGEAIVQAQSVRRQWMDYELSPTAVFETPSLMDVRIPEVSLFYKEFGYFERQYPDYDKKLKNAPVSDQFIEDAQRLAKAFKDAQNRAWELDKGKGEQS